MFEKKRKLLPSIGLNRLDVENVFLLFSADATLLLYAFYTYFVHKSREDSLD